MRTTEPVFELFLNYACTAKCPFCYNPPITPELLRRDLSFEQAAEALYKGARSGARLLNLHGGEPTLRDDLPKLLALAKKLGFSRITVVTNGVRLGDEGYARALVAAGATHFRVSVHAAEASLHDKIVAIPGAFEKLRAGLGLLRAEGVPAGLNFVLIRSNLGALEPFIRRFMLEDGHDDVIVYFPHRRGMMALNEASEGISYADAAGPVRRAAALAEGRGLLLANFTPCVLPELAGLMIDWGEERGRTAMVHPEGKTTDVLEMKDAQRVKVAACASCALAARCHGAEREYLAARGESEFKPQAEAAAA